MQFTNPLAHPFFLPLAVVTGVMLLAALGYAVFAERKNLGQFHKSSFLPKILSSAIIAPAAVLAILSGPGGLCLLAMVMSMIGVVEYASITGLPRRYLPAALLSAVALPLAACVVPAHVVSILVAALLLNGVVAICSYRTPADKSQPIEPQTFRDAAAACLCVAYAPLLASFAVRLSALPGGAGILLALIAAVGMSDTMALVCGRSFGRRKLAPHVSPNKTVAGCGGNLLGAYIGFLGLYFACPTLPWVALLVLPVFIAASALFGDLFESLIKRSFGVKDAGTWLPGFGGLLDRIDSLLFVMPVAYIFLALVL